MSGKAGSAARRTSSAEASGEVELCWPGKVREAIARPGPGLVLERRERAGASVLPSDTWCNRLIEGENAAVLGKLAGEMKGEVDLIYVDPPFASGQDFFLSTGNRERGDASTSSRGKPVFSDRWGKGPAAYMTMLHERLALAHLLLAKSGLIYVHLDTRMSALARLLLDELFGRDRLFNEIIWHYQSGGRSRTSFSFKHDTILVYGKGKKQYFNREAISKPRGAEKRNHMKRGEDADGRKYYSIRSARKLYKYYDDDLQAPDDVWHDISHLQQKDPERTGYPTQKPERLLERILLASSPPGGLVLDFFSGSGTTAVVAEKLGRRWLACDRSPRAVAITRRRLLALPECRAFEVMQARSENGEPSGQDW